MAYDHHNLVQHTVEARPRWTTTPCAIGWAINRYANGGRGWTWCHRWPRGEGNALREGHCLNCGKTLDQVRVRINPKTGEPVRKPSRMAREIASMPRDVPPVVFVNRNRA